MIHDITTSWANANFNRYARNQYILVRPSVSHTGYQSVLRPLKIIGVTDSKLRVMPYNMSDSIMQDNQTLVFKDRVMFVATDEGDLHVLVSIFEGSLTLAQKQEKQLEQLNILLAEERKGFLETFRFRLLPSQDLD
jgi:hypothetical protein